MKKNIIISAVNIQKGGPLSILTDCLSTLVEMREEFNITAIVNSRRLLESISGVEYIETIEFPKSVKSYIYRIYLEYFLFKKISKKRKPYLWLSLHDISPNVEAIIRAVYCHNAAPFYGGKYSARDFLIQPSFCFFTFFYSIFYKINIEKNDYIIVQQQWLRKMFQDNFTSKPIIVSHPNIESSLFESSRVNREDYAKEYTFFYPTMPRVFKNIEIIAEAIKIINFESKNKLNFSVHITISGDENRYARFIKKKYGSLKEIKFIGYISRKEVFDIYQISSCLLFPSKLETWGLPISEFKKTNKMILAADLPYAHETVGTYKNISFFDPESPDSLAALMIDAIKGNLQCDGNILGEPVEPFAMNWHQLFDFLLTRS